MPNRILKESITVSATIDQLRADEERLFYRLIVVADDYGLMDGRPEVVRSRCFPLRVDRIKNSTIAAWLDRLVAVDLIRRYEADGQPYLALVTWNRHQRQRAQRSRFPTPPAGLVDRDAPLSSADIGGHLTADDSGNPQMTAHARGSARAESESESEIESGAEYESGSGVPTPPESEPPSAASRKVPVLQGRSGPAGITYPTEFESCWSDYPSKRGKHAAFLEWERRRKERVSADDLRAAARNLAIHVEERGTEEQFIPLAATFFGKKRTYLDFVSGVPKVAVSSGGSAARNGSRREAPDEQIERIFGTVR